MSAPRDQLWLTCSTKTCCYTTVVYPTGADIYRIATTLVVPPWQFTVALPADDDAADGFALDRSPQRHRVALAKAVSSRSSPAPCTFLVHATDGAARCGLGDLRPGPCKSFPAYLIDGCVRVAAGVCACREWTLDDIDEGSERAGLEQEASDRRVYQRVIADWNEYVARNDEPEALEYPDFCRYLLDAYAEMAHASV